MKVQIEATRPRWLRLPRTWRMRALVTLVAAGIVAVPVAWANHQFIDVPNTNPHHDDIGAIFGARITAGCNPPSNTLYCPADPVRRDQMASFLRRGLGRVGAAGTTADLTLTTAFQDIASTNLTSGGATGGTGFVLLFGSFQATRTAAAATLHNRVEFRFIETQTGFTSNVNSVTMRPPTGGANMTQSPAKQWIFSIPTGTLRTYRLQARRVFDDPDPITVSSRLITALYVPFGSTGGSTLGGTLGTPEMPEPTGEER